eukprot:8786647-Pyramimonas_sp.AAC.1
MRRTPGPACRRSSSRCSTPPLLKELRPQADRSCREYGSLGHGQGSDNRHTTGICKGVELRITRADPRL